MPAAAATTMLANGTLEPHSTSQKLQRNDSLDSEDDCAVFGVLLSEERRTAEGGKCGSLILGSIVVSDASIRRRRCTELRKILQEQFLALSGNFVFLSRDGWPILRHQETSVRAGQVINDRNAIEIQRNFAKEKSRVAITAESKGVLGVISCDLNSSLPQLREAIADQLKEIRSLRGEYQFTERNAWPVPQTQEGQLMVLDICNNDTICVIPGHTPVGPRFSHIPVTSKVSKQDETDFGLSSPPPKVVSSNKRWPGTEKSTAIAKSDLVAKPILLSYVRAEAADHALRLKEELMKRKFSVYLDVHEIQTGNDWQDALNYAVSNCTVFVPLVTPQYGMTQWTNREVKLADVLNKYIIPVNFLDRWPPECLAIQFASTQYICWKSASQHTDSGISVMEKEPIDYRIWEKEYVVNVAEEICKHFKHVCQNKEGLLNHLRHTVKKNPRISTKSQKDYKLKPERYSLYALDNNVGNILEEGGDEGKNNFVVISAHPKDFLFAHEAKRCLMEEGLNVWSSVELLDENPDNEVFSSGTGMPLSTIPEGEACNPSPKLSQVKFDSDVPDKRGLCRLSSQLSSIGGMTESLTPETIERLRLFQTKVDQAGVIVVLISQAYTDSKTSLQQIFYCEHRKKVILVKMDNKPVRSIYTMLMGNDMLTYTDNPQIIPSLICKVKRCFDNKSNLTSKEDASEAKMQYLVSFMKKNLPEVNHCVYIAGSTKFQNERSELICGAIGKALAKLKNVNIVTGGFHGVGDTVAHAFMETKLLEVPNNYVEEPVIHILPTKDPQDFSQKANQNEDGTFEAPNYGKTVFLGDSVKERESAVARLFDICIVIEGGPGAAHEVEEFIWNDHYVIPIISTGGAAGGQFGVPLKILETPPSASKTDWSVLSEKEATPEQVAEAVANIVKSLNMAVAEHAKKEAEKPQGRKVRRRSRRSRRKMEHPVFKDNDDAPKNKLTLPPIESIDLEDESDTVCSGTRKWQKFFKIFKPARVMS